MRHCGSFLEPILLTVWEQWRESLNHHEVWKGSVTFGHFTCSEQQRVDDPLASTNLKLSDLLSGGFVIFGMVSTNRTSRYSATYPSSRKWLDQRMSILGKFIAYRKNCSTFRTISQQATCQQNTNGEPTVICSDKLQIG